MIFFFYKENIGFRQCMYKIEVLNLKRRSLLLCFLLLCFCLVLQTGCGAKAKDGASDVADMKLICEETISPNEDEAALEADLVFYTIKVYQGQENQIVVCSESNSAFFEPLQQEMAYDREITEDDINIQWTTIMGNPEPTEGDQLAVAHVSVLEDGTSIGEWKISFVNQGIEWIEAGLQ